MHNSIARNSCISKCFSGIFKLAYARRLVPVDGGFFSFKKGKKDMNEHEFWKERRHLEEMPFDKRFDVDGNSELCHETGYEVFDGEDWWDEFVDSNGDFQYGR